MSKILVCEDDKFLSGAYRIKLVKLGFEVQLASDGDDALAHLRTFTPDLILLDLIMPGKDGFSTLIQLKANERWKKIPVIVASNLGQKEDIDKSMALGANDFIVKSDTSLEQVVAKINTLLQIPQAPQAQSSPQTSQNTQPQQIPPTTPNPTTQQIPQAPQTLQTPQPQQTQPTPQTPQSPGNAQSPHPILPGKDENVR